MQIKEGLLAWRPVSVSEQESLSVCRPASRASSAGVLHDEQNTADLRGLRIDRVGVKGVRLPIRIQDKSAEPLSTVATVGMTVDLDASLKGTHMSRFMQVLHDHGDLVEMGQLRGLLMEMRERLQSEDAHLEMEFPFFLRKDAPVSGISGIMDYTAGFEASVVGGEYNLQLRLMTPVTTLCPCSKAISRYGAHNQRGVVTVCLQSHDVVWFEDLIRLVEASASSELYSILKRPDEKAVTERAYENPVFVEDLVRNVALKLNEMQSVISYSVEAENYESIHSHNAYARIEKRGG